VLVIVNGHYRACVKRALIGFARNQRRTAVSTLECAAFGVQPQPAFGLFRPMAADAVEFKDRFDLLLEIHFVRGSGGRNGPSQKGGGQEEEISVHSILRYDRYC